LVKFLVKLVLSFNCAKSSVVTLSVRVAAVLLSTIGGIGAKWRTSFPSSTNRPFSVLFLRSMSLCEKRNSSTP